MNELMKILGLEYFVDECLIKCFRLSDYGYYQTPERIWTYKTEFAKQVEAYNARQYTQTVSTSSLSQQYHNNLYTPMSGLSLTNPSMQTKIFVSAGSSISSGAALQNNLGDSILKEAENIMIAGRRTRPWYRKLIDWWFCL